MRKQVTSREAANNFSTVIKAVENNGIISITKHTKERYIVMTKEEYERRFTSRELLTEELENGIIGDYIHKKGYVEGIAKVRLKNDKIEIKILQMADKEPLSYVETVIPKKLARISKTSIWQIEYDIHEAMLNGFKETAISTFDEEFESSETQKIIEKLLSEYNAVKEHDRIEVIW